VGRKEGTQGTQEREKRTEAREVSSGDTQFLRPSTQDVTSLANYIRQELDSILQDLSTCIN